MRKLITIIELLIKGLDVQSIIDTYSMKRKEHKGKMYQKVACKLTQYIFQFHQMGVFPLSITNLLIFIKILDLCRNGFKTNFNLKNIHSSINLKVKIFDINNT